jgi:hypothetical protein
VVSARNGPPGDPRSLHYIEPYGQVMNQYQAAITFVGEVLQFYGERGSRALNPEKCWRRVDLSLPT